MVDRWTAYAQIAPAHEAITPSWMCARDGRPWPCPIARVQLGTSMDAAQLRITLAARLDAAARDMPDASPAELHERFLSWALMPAGP